MTPPTKSFYSGPEVAELLGYTRGRIHQLLKNGTIEAVQGPANIWLISGETVAELLRTGLPNARNVAARVSVED